MRLSKYLSNKDYDCGYRCLGVQNSLSITRILRPPKRRHVSTNSRISIREGNRPNAGKSFKLASDRKTTMRSTTKLGEQFCSRRSYHGDLFY